MPLTAVVVGERQRGVRVAAARAKAKRHDPCLLWAVAQQQVAQTVRPMPSDCSVVATAGVLRGSVAILRIAAVVAVTLVVAAVVAVTLVVAAVVVVVVVLVDVPNLGDASADVDAGASDEAQLVVGV